MVRAGCIMTDQQRIDIKADGIYVNNVKVPGYIAEDSVTVTPGERGDMAEVHLTLLADIVHCDSSPVDTVVVKPPNFISTTLGGHTINDVLDKAKQAQSTTSTHR